MKKFNLNDMINGWVIGNFDPSLYKTNDFEVAIKKYKAGDYDPKHYHKIGTEYTIIMTGQVEMLGILYKENDILIIEPGEETDFKALSDVITAVIKIPGINNDKYLL
jgi:quercetin dioxygenase-like cupin family protein